MDRPASLPKHLYWPWARAINNHNSIHSHKNSFELQWKFSENHKNWSIQENKQLSQVSTQQNSISINSYLTKLKEKLPVPNDSRNRYKYRLPYLITQPYSELTENQMAQNKNQYEPIAKKNTKILDNMIEILKEDKNEKAKISTNQQMKPIKSTVGSLKKKENEQSFKRFPTESEIKIVFQKRSRKGPRLIQNRIIKQAFQNSSITRKSINSEHRKRINIQQYSSSKYSLCLESSSNQFSKKAQQVSGPMQLDSVQLITFYPKQKASLKQ